jgi:hypothetical protein
MDAAANPLDEGIKTLRRLSPSLPLWLLSLPLFLFPVLFLPVTCKEPPWPSPSIAARSCPELRRLAGKIRHTSLFLPTN